MIKRLKSKLFISLLSVAIIAVVGAFQVHASTVLAGLFSSRQILISVTPAPSVTPSPTPAWTMTQKIAEAKVLLAGAKPGVFGDPITYTEQRYSLSGKTTDKQIKEPEKEIALAVLNTETGEVKTFMIRKRGGDLIAPAGWQIEVLQRPSGIRWNGWNTAYMITSPANYIVIGNVYPDETDKKVAQKNKANKTVYVTQRTVEYRYYVPYGPDLHTSGLAEIGQSYTKNMVQQALNELRSANVGSRAMPGQLVADVFGQHGSFFEHIPLLEQTDMTEFQIDPANTIERAQVIIGANGPGAFNATCNNSSACGWLQFTPGTYATMVKTYPSANLIKDFRSGAADHMNSMKAAILLYDENLRALIKVQGDQVVNDSKLEEYLASSYNGAPQWVHKTLKASILSGIQDWINALTPKTGGLKDETKGYLVKLRWLNQQSALSQKY